MDYNALLAKAADLFSVKSATGHFCYQRLTALVLIPLTPVPIIFLNKVFHASHAESADWLASPIHAMAIVAWLGLAIYHAALGVQVVLEDYVSDLAIRHRAIRTANLAFLGLGFAALLAIIKILLIR